MRTARPAPRRPSDPEIENRSGPVLVGTPPEASRRIAEVFCDVEVLPNGELPGSVAVAKRLLRELTREVERLSRRNVTLERRLRRVKPAGRAGKERGRRTAREPAIEDRS